MTSNYIEGEKKTPKSTVELISTKEEEEEKKKKVQVPNHL